MMNHECQCTGAGWCERHKVHKSENMVRLCQKRGAYWEAWENGTGIEQIKLKLSELAPPPPRKDRAVDTEGWGDKVTVFLKGLGVTEESYKAIKQKFGLPPTCGCSQRREWLNKVGRWWNERTE